MFKVGQKIRSFDFVSRDDCYVVGTIVAINNYRYEFEAEYSVTEGVKEEYSAGRIMVTAIEEMMHDEIREELGKAPRLSLVA